MGKHRLVGYWMVLAIAGACGDAGSNSTSDASLSGGPGSSGGATGSTGSTAGSTTDTPTGDLPTTSGGTDSDAIKLRRGDEQGWDPSELDMSIPKARRTSTLILQASCVLALIPN